MANYINCTFIALSVHWKCVSESYKYRPTKQNKKKTHRTPFNAKCVRSHKAHEDKMNNRKWEYTTSSIRFGVCSTSCWVRQWCVYTEPTMINCNNQQWSTNQMHSTKTSNCQQTHTKKRFNLWVCGYNYDILHLWASPIEAPFTRVIITKTEWDKSLA